MAKSSIKDARAHWEKAMTDIRSMAKSRLAYEYTGAQSTLATQYNISNKYTRKDIEEGLKSLDLGDSLGDLNYGQINALESRLKLQDSIDEYNLPSISQ